MTESTAFNEAMEAINQGEVDRARELLSRLLRKEKNNPDYWLWMSSVVFATNEKIFCLENVLQLDPENAAAKRGLILLGGLPPVDVEPAPLERRHWEVDFVKRPEEQSRFKKFITNPLIRVLGVICVLVVVIGLILAGIYGTRGMYKQKLTITPIPWTATSTQTSSPTPKLPSATPRITQTPKPLWMMLDATYTPVPLYVNTPHPRLEAYRLALRAFEKGDYDGMIRFLEQTLQDESVSADILYYFGEAYRQMGDYEVAIQNYNDALGVDPSFAPVYLSKALVQKAKNPKADLKQNLNRAISLDPLYGEAYLERAKYLFSIHDYQGALDDLNSASEVIPTNPDVYLELAEVNLVLNNPEGALKHAQRSLELDITFLQTYLVLAKAYLANGRLESALENVQIYGSYVEDDALSYAILGGVYYKMGDDLNLALETLEKAKTLDDEVAIVHYYHGLTSLALEDPLQAVNDLYIARSLEPDNVEYDIWFGIALYEVERYKEAYNLLANIEPSVRSDELFVLFYYYKAKAGMELSQFDPVENALTALLDLPEEIVPPEWLQEAKDYLEPATQTPTPSTTPSPSPTRTITVTP